MTVNVSGTGTRIHLVASSTYPIGIVLTQFSDDADAIDIPQLEIGSTKMGVNGDLIKWQKPIEIKANVNIVPGGQDDILLGVLLQANRIGRGKLSANDNVIMTVTYPDGRIIILNDGIITGGSPGLSISSEARYKTKPYSFSFGNYSSVGA